MSIYLMVGMNVKDREVFAEYVRKAMVSLQKYDVEALVGSDSPVAPEGKSPFGRYVVLKFRDQAAFDAWYQSPEYQEAIPLRRAAAETGFFVTVEGFAGS